MAGGVHVVDEGLANEKGVVAVLAFPNAQVDEDVGPDALSFDGDDDGKGVVEDEESTFRSNKYAYPCLSSVRNYVPQRGTTP